jgi:hypothetical protein
LTEGLGATEDGIRVSEDVDWNELRAVGQGIMRLVAWCEEVLKEKKRSLSRQTSVLGCFKSSSDIRASPLVLLDIGGDNPDDRPAIHKMKCLLLRSSFACHISYFL